MMRYTQTNKFPRRALSKLLWRNGNGNDDATCGTYAPINEQTVGDWTFNKNITRSRAKFLP